MNAHTSYVLMALLAVTGMVAATPAFADDHVGTIESYPCPDCIGDGRDQAMMAAAKAIPIMVSTDMATYDHDSLIAVEGQVANVRFGMPVTVTVISPMGNIADIRQLDVNRDGSYSTEFNTAGNSWKYDGTYTIRVQYGEIATSNKVEVDLMGGVPLADRPDMSVPTVCGDDELEVTGTCIPYMISGGMVSGATTSSSGDMSVLSLDIESDDDGMLSISPLVSGCNERGDPLIYVDDEQSDDYTFDGSMITVMFMSGTERIDVIGTCVVPEFGTVAVLVLVVAIVSIVAITARSRLSVVPRF